MLDLLEALGARSADGDRRTFGVVVCTVIDNVDLTSLGRVQINVPFLPGFMPWARVAVPMTGTMCGTYFIPQVGDEVLVAFHHGDIHEAYVIGSLWNMTDRPPSALPTDPVTKRIIKTPLGQQVVFDDTLQSVTITNTTQQTMALQAAQAQLATAGGTASVTLDIAGNVTIQGAVSLSLKAPSITIEGETITINGSATATLKGGAACTIQGGVVNIN
jgi:uncharacterized protein involved in type VI secretion and phage assembly